MFVFPKRCDGDDVLIHIFPSMQKEVQKVIENAKQDARIRRVRVFGSAVTLRCGIGSDLDIAIDAPSVQSEDDFLVIHRSIRKGLDVNTDIVHYNQIRSPLLKDEIDKKGVDVYVNRLY